jgi:hypothetical protein
MVILNSHLNEKIAMVLLYNCNSNKLIELTIRMLQKKYKLIL